MRSSKKCIHIMHFSNSILTVEMLSELTFIFVKSSSIEFGLMDMNACSGQTTEYNFFSLRHFRVGNFKFGSDENNSTNEKFGEFSSTSRVTFSLCKGYVIII